MGKIAGASVCCPDDDDGEDDEDERSISQSQSSVHDHSLHWESLGVEKSVEKKKEKQ